MSSSNDQNELCLVLEPHYPVGGSSREPDDGDDWLTLPAPDATTEWLRWERDMVYQEIIRPSVEAHGYKIQRSNARVNPDRIDRQMRDVSQDADMVIANLTGKDPRVFYCLASRLASEKAEQTLLIMRDDEDHILELGAWISFPVLYSEDAIRARQSGAVSRRETGRYGIEGARIDLTRLVIRRRDDAKNAAKELNRGKAPAPTEPPPQTADARASEPGPVSRDGGPLEDVIHQAFSEFVSKQLQGAAGGTVDEFTRRMFPNRNT